MDGTGTDAGDTVVAATPGRPELGKVVLVRGTLEADADLGMGARYPAVLRDAQVR
jgi:hypothetical protein